MAEFSIDRSIGAAGCEAEVENNTTHYVEDKLPPGKVGFRHALGTPGITFNPAILVMAEKVDHAPGIKNGKDYLNLRAQLLKVGHQALAPGAYGIPVRAARIFSVTTTGATPMGSTWSNPNFATIKNGCALVFIVMGEDEKSVDEMSKAMEAFDTVLPVRRGVTTVIGSAPQRKPN